MTNQEMLKAMFKSQDELNSMLDPEWKHRDDWDHAQALRVELAEVLVELNYKWWKDNGPIDWEKVRDELVDCWHFLLNIQLKQGSAYEVIEVLDSLLSADALVLATPADIRMAIGGVMTGDKASWFLPICIACGMDFPALYTRYVIKNTLNRFRWDNGYKTGEYKWNTTQDVKKAHSLVVEGITSERLYFALGVEYKKHLAKLAKVGV